MTHPEITNGPVEIARSALSDIREICGARLDADLGVADPDVAALVMAIDEISRAAGDVLAQWGPAEAAR
jgi:hypothetical protein